MTNYTTLTETVIEQIEDDSTEFSDYLTKAIIVAEDRLFKDLDLFLLREFEDVTTTQGDPLVTLPTGYEFSDNIVFFNSNTMVDLKKKTLDYIKDYWPNKTTEGLPKYYAIHGSNSIYLAPTPNGAYTTEVSVTKRPTTITSSNQTNYYTDNAYTAFLAAVLVEMTKFIKDYQTSQLHEKEYENQYMKHNDMVKTKRLESGMILANKEIGTQER